MKSIVIIEKLILRTWRRLSVAYAVLLLLTRLLGLLGCRLAYAFLAIFVKFSMLVIKVGLKFFCVDVFLSLLLRAHALIECCAIDFVRDERFAKCRLHPRLICGL